jgi:glycosyltransferase involved in cell wall biosynthesis
VLILSQTLARPQGRAPVILQILPALESGGAEQGCIDIAQAIRAAGGKAIVASQGGTKARLQELARTQATHIDLPVASKNLWVIWRNIGRIRRVIRMHGVDVVHVRSRAPAWSAYFACRREHVPMMTTCHAPYNARSRLKRFYNSIMAAGVYVIAVSEYVAGYMRDQFKTPDAKIRVIHRSIDLAKFHPSLVTPDRMMRMSEAWRIPDGATVILLPGRLTRWKGQKVLIEAIGMLGNPDVVAVCIGSDQGRKGYTQELHKLIKSKNLDGQVRLVDHTTDMPAACMAAHVVVSTSIEPEGFGRIAIEGQAMGRLVIASSHGGSKETIIDGKTGWLVPPNDPGALARALHDALALSIDQRAKIGQAAMAHMAQNFSREKMMDATLAVYNEILTMPVTPKRSIWARWFGRKSA